MISSANYVLEKNQFESLYKRLFVLFRTKDQILESLEMQEDMKKWVAHHIAEAKLQNISCVDVRVWPEKKTSLLGSSNQSLIKRIEDQGMFVSIDNKKSDSIPVHSVRDVFLTITIPSDK